MSNLLTLTYICSIVGLLFTGLLLLCIKVAPQLTDVKYHRAKMVLGTAMLCVSMGNGVQMDAITNGETVTVFSAAVLVVCTLQACMFTFIVLTVLQSKYVTKRNIFKHLSPTFIFVAVYLASLLVWPDRLIYHLSDYRFNVPLLLRTLFAGVYLIQIIIYIHLFRRERRIYIDKTENYFADLGRYESQWASRLFYQATSVGILVLVFVIFPSRMADYISTFIITLFYFLFGVGFINYQYGIIRITPAIFQAEQEEEQTGTDTTLAELLYSQQLYLQQGISLADYTAALGISERKISTFIKNQSGQTFKRWVNTQRVEHAKNLLAQCPELNIDHIAEMSGFADKSQFSKTFREICGITFSAYKKG